MPEKAASTEQNHAVGTSRLDPHLRGIGDRPGYAPRLRGLHGESEPPRKRITFGCSWLGDRAGAGGAGLGVWSSASRDAPNEPSGDERASGWITERTVGHVKTQH